MPSSGISEGDVPLATWLPPAVKKARWQKHSDVCTHTETLTIGEEESRNLRLGFAKKLRHGSKGPTETENPADGIPGTHHLWSFQGKNTPGGVAGVPSTQASSTNIKAGSSKALKY